MMGEYKDLGYLSAVQPWQSVPMYCDDCKVEWVGCWDNFACPICGDGELPSFDTSESIEFKLTEAK